MTHKKLRVTNKVPEDFELEESDVRRMVRLLGQVAASRQDHTGMKRQLMDGLCELIGADSWIWALGCQMEAGKRPVYTSFMHGGFSDERFATYLTATEHPDMAWLTAPILDELAARQTQVTRLRQQMDRKNLFPSSAAFSFWSAADVGPIILTLRPLDDQSVGVIGIYRRADQQFFSERESRIAHILLSEVPWLHEKGWPEDRGATVPRLIPRQRLILNLLLDGRSRKEIAAHFRLSENTVASYVKEIYRHFKVNSHAGLMRRFQQGDGGDL